MLIDYIIAACLWIAGLWAPFIGFVAVCLFERSFEQEG